MWLMSLSLIFSNWIRLNPGVVFNSWAVLESRRLVQVIPELVRKIWNNWEIRVLVLVSLTLQLCLLHFGCRRRYNAKTWLSVFLWLSYVGADSVATVALGVISNNPGNCDDSQLRNELIAFWAPFLLLHLGGQDTITAYAVQDNELWLRHLLGLVVQSGVALYIILLSWKVSWLSLLTILLFLAGIIKYAERSWVLKSVSTEISSANDDMSSHEYSCMDNAFGIGPERTNHDAKFGIFCFFKTFGCLFLNQKADIPASLRRLLNQMAVNAIRLRSFSSFRDFQTAWNMIEGELGYAYDVFFTKAPFFFTTWGFLIRTFSFTSILIVFVLFLVKECHKHPFVDLIITLLLLVGAILMEIYGVVLLCTSDWPFQRYGKGSLGNCIEALLTRVRCGCAKLTSKQRWSNSMCQLDLLGFCLKDFSLRDGDGSPTLSSHFRGWALFKMLPKLNGELEMLIYMTHKKVSTAVKDSLFRLFFLEREFDGNGFVPNNYDQYITQGPACIETYQRIIIWHIATDLCFHTNCGEDNESKVCRAVSKDLSDYMMYILVMLPFVLSAGSAKGFESTCEDVKSRILDIPSLPNLTKVEVCGWLLSFDCRSNLSEEQALLDDKLFGLGVLLAKTLNESCRGNTNLWRIMSSFWCENLVYVATLCPGNKHAQLLSNGGEFLTHVWLLEKHFEFTVRVRCCYALKAGVSSVAVDDEE